MDSQTLLYLVPVTGALANTRPANDVLPDDVRALVDLAESLALDDLQLDITMEDIEADLRYGRD